MNKLRTIGFAALVALVGLLYGWTQFRYEFGLFPPQSEVAPPVPLNAPSHAVSLAMVESSDRMLNRQAAPFSCSADDGKTYSLSELLKKGPVVLTFNKVGCPCSVAAQPMFNQLADAYPMATLLGVLDAEAGPGRLWLGKVKASYPQLLDPGLKIVRAYGAENSVYVVLIDSSGKIVEHWPGISGPMLRDLSAHLARLTASAEAKLNLRDAPADLYSGCPFEL